MGGLSGPQPQLFPSRPASIGSNNVVTIVGGTSTRMAPTLNGNDAIGTGSNVSSRLGRAAYCTAVLIHVASVSSGGLTLRLYGADPPSNLYAEETFSTTGHHRMEVNQELGTGELSYQLLANGTGSSSVGVVTLEVIWT